MAGGTDGWMAGETVDEWRLNEGWRGRISELKKTERNWCYEGIDGDFESLEVVGSDLEALAVIVLSELKKNKKIM